jgi:hypothetical protein
MPRPRTSGRYTSSTISTSTVVWSGWNPAGHVLVAQQHDSHRGDPRMELIALLSDCADRAERLRRRGANVVLLTGSELSLFTVGFLPGETLAERLTLIADPLRVRPLIGEVRARINDFLQKTVDVVRARFGGPVSYASLPLGGRLGPVRRHRHRRRLPLGCNGRALPRPRPHVRRAGARPPLGTPALRRA